VHVRRSLATGEVTDETPYGPLGIHHRLPAGERTGGGTRGLRHEPPLDAGFAPLGTSPDGTCVLACHSTSRATTLFTATRRDGRVLAPTWGYDVAWLPATTPRK
jgi:hypothetical protein